MTPSKTTTTLGFTGHRTLAQPQVIQESINSAIKSCCAPNLEIKAISSAASGADTLFLEEIIKLYIPFQVLLPFPENEFAKDFDQVPHAWQRVKHLLSKANTIQITEPQPSRNDAYFVTGKRTVDQSDILIAVWNGKHAAGKGGTGDVVAYAKSQKKPVIIIDSVSGKRLDPNQLSSRP